MRDYYLTSGWKMNLGVKESISYAKKLAGYINSCTDLHENLKLVIFTDLLSLYSVSLEFKNSILEVGAPDIFWEDSGAFTGEVSPLFLKNIGCKNVLLAHPERINNVYEDSIMINKKIKAALRNDMVPFLILTEKKNTTKAKIISQVKRDFLTYTEGLDKSELLNIVIIYEPIWAINTTEAAPANYITDMVDRFRESLNKVSSSNLGDKMYICYGGGVNIRNFKDILDVNNLDGIGIGKASLDFKFFTSCINMANSQLLK